MTADRGKKGSSPYSIADRVVPELILVSSMQVA